MVRKYFQHYIMASDSRGHGIHSPFVFDFVKRVLNDRQQYSAYKKIEDLRGKLEKDNTQIEQVDLGALSTTRLVRHRTIAEIAKRSAVPAKLGRLLFRIAHYYQPRTIVELGTSLGLSTAYLAFGNAAATVTSMEGAPAIAAIAEDNFEILGLKNIKLVRGNFDDTFPAVILEAPSPDLVYIDGNHRKEPTLRYFNMILPQMGESSLIVFDDIHWSEEMGAAWAVIRDHPQVLLTVDLFFFGLVFFRKEFRVKQHFAIRLRN